MATKIKIVPILFGAGIGLAGTAAVAKMRGKKATGKQYLLFTLLGAAAGFLYPRMGSSNAAGNVGSALKRRPIDASAGCWKKDASGICRMVDCSQGGSTTMGGCL